MIKDVIVVVVLVAIAVSVLVYIGKQKKKFIKTSLVISLTY